MPDELIPIPEGWLDPQFKGGVAFEPDDLPEHNVPPPTAPPLPPLPMKNMVLGAFGAAVRPGHRVADPIVPPAQPTTIAPPAGLHPGGVGEYSAGGKGPEGIGNGAGRVVKAGDAWVGFLNGTFHRGSLEHAHSGSEVSFLEDPSQPREEEDLPRVREDEEMDDWWPRWPGEGRVRKTDGLHYMPDLFRGETIYKKHIGFIELDHLEDIRVQFNSNIRELKNLVDAYRREFDFSSGESRQSAYQAILRVIHRLKEVAGLVLKVQYKAAGADSVPLKPGEISGLLMMADEALDIKEVAMFDLYQKVKKMGP